MHSRSARLVPTCSAARAPTVVIAPEHTRSRLFTWARSTAVATLVTNVAVALVALAPAPAKDVAYPSAFWPNTGWAFLLIPLTGALFLLAVVLTMEYRVRSRDAADPLRRNRLRQLVLLLAPTSLQIAALVVLIGFILTL